VINEPWQSVPRGWGMFVGGVVCDYCGRWESGSTENLEQFLKSGWKIETDDSTIPVGGGGHAFGPTPARLSSVCIFCQTYGIDNSKALSESQRLLLDARCKAAWWQSIVKKEEELSELLKRKGQAATGNESSPEGQPPWPNEANPKKR
jgi:hypothetical protein